MQTPARLIIAVALAKQALSRAIRHEWAVPAAAVLLWFALIVVCAMLQGHA